VMYLCNSSLMLFRNQILPASHCQNDMNIDLGVCVCHVSFSPIGGIHITSMTLFVITLVFDTSKASAIIPSLIYETVAA